MIKLKDILNLFIEPITIMDDSSEEIILNLAADCIEFASLYLSESLLNGKVTCIQNGAGGVQIFVVTKKEEENE